jgi:hypothetical protein
MNIETSHYNKLEKHILPYKSHNIKSDIENYTKKSHLQIITQNAKELGREHSLRDSNIKSAVKN